MKSQICDNTNFISDHIAFTAYILPLMLLMRLVCFCHLVSCRNANISDPIIPGPYKSQVLRKASFQPQYAGSQDVLPSDSACFYIIIYMKSPLASWALNTDSTTACISKLYIPFYSLETTTFLDTSTVPFPHLQSDLKM